MNVNTTLFARRWLGTDTARLLQLFHLALLFAVQDILHDTTRVALLVIVLMLRL